MTTLPTNQFSTRLRISAKWPRRLLLAHVIGHSMGLLQITKVATVNPEWHGDSWLLTGLAGATTTNLVAAALWTAAIVGFGALAAAVFGWLPMAWWQPLAIASATVSLIGLVLVPVACPFLSTVGAFAANVALFAAVLWYQWAPRDLAA